MNIEIFNPGTQHFCDFQTLNTLNKNHTECMCVWRHTLQWTRVCPQGCSRRTAWRSRDGGTPYTHPHAWRRWWEEDLAIRCPAGSCGCASESLQTWTGHSTGAPSSAGLPHVQLQFAKRISKSQKTNVNMKTKSTYSWSYKSQRLKIQKKTWHYKNP